MAFNIIRNDITKVTADAIVNTANPSPKIGRGTDYSVYAAAGEEKLLAAREKIGIIEPGAAVSTPAFDLEARGIKYIIHTVGIRYSDGNQGELDILKKCYANSLKTAKELGCKSVAIPLLGTGNYHFPKELGLEVAVAEISSFLLETENEINITLVVYDEEAYKISEKHFDEVEDFLGKNLKPSSFNSIRACRSVSFDLNDLIDETCPSVSYKSAKPEFREPKAYKSPKVRKSIISTRSLPDELDAFINQTEETMNFQNTLQKMIADRNLENSVVYSKALIDRKFFSKIITHKNYIPKKQTVMALGLALELSLAEYEAFLASAGFAFMMSDKFDAIIKYCVIHRIYNLIQIDIMLNDHGLACFAPN